MEGEARAQGWKREGWKGEGWLRHSAKEVVFCTKYEKTM